MRKTLLTMTLLAPMAMATVAAPASAAPNTYAGPGGGRQCEASDSRDVTVNSATNTVAVTDDPITAGNNFGCYTNLSVAAGDTITFQHDAVCGGGVPRVLVGFKDGHYENTFDTGSCTSPTAGGLGSASYTLARSGKIRVFAFINDRGDSGTVTYSNLVIDGNVINF